MTLWPWPRPVAPWPFTALLLVAAAGTFVAIHLITHELFVMSEARTYILWPQHFDLGSYLLFPDLRWGPGRLGAMATFRLTGFVCGVDHACVNAAGALLLTACTVVLMVHTRQVTGSVFISLGVAVLWVLSPTVLGVSLWQSARFDSMAFVGALAASAFWWDAFGRVRLSIGRTVVFSVVSVLVLAFAFNAKEITYYLVGVVVILAVTRGYPIGRVRRNLLLTIIPLVYAAWFIAYGLIHIQPDYAANSSWSLIPENAVTLVRGSLGLAPAFMGIWHPSPSYLGLQQVAGLGYVVVLLAALTGLAMGIRRLRRSTVEPSSVMSWGPEAYLLAVIGATLIINSRSAGADTYYMLIPYWAAVVLGALLLRRLSGWQLPGRVLALGLVVMFTASALVAYASHYTERSAWRILSDGSASMRHIGSTVRVLLAGRSVESVSWRTIGDPNGWQYLLRGNAAARVTREIWPWLIGDADARPPVTPVDEGDAAVLRASVSSFDEPGEVLIVISEDYRLRLLGYEGEVLLDLTGGPDPPVVAS